MKGFCGFFLLCVLALCGCGLPQITTALQPPGQPILATTATPVFTVNSTTLNSEFEFQGFELYYKFYADSSLIEDNLQANNISESDIRNVYHYLPACSGLDSFSGTPPADLHANKPLLPVDGLDRGTVFSFTITFPSLSTQNVPPVVSQGGTILPNISIRRNVGDVNPQSSTQNSPKPFVPLLASDPHTYQPSDIDIQGIWTTVQPSLGTGVVYLAMYALSYGLSDFTNPLFSTPVYLGYIQINTNQ